MAGSLPVFDGTRLGQVSDLPVKIRRVSGDPVRMESIFSFQAWGQPPAFPFLKKILFDDAFVNISSCCNLFFLFYKEENRELGAIFCLLLLLLSQKHLEKC